MTEERGCRCVMCSICGGTGTIKVPSIIDYDMDMCDNCDGGVVEECDYCIEQRDRDQDADERRKTS